MEATDSRNEGAIKGRADGSFGEFEVVADGGGFGVRRIGDPEPLSHHATREQAEAAARMHSDEGTAIDARKDIFSGGEDDPSSARRTFAGAGLFALAVIALIVVVALIVAL